jgi:hypothetical protein
MADREVAPDPETQIAGFFERYELPIAEVGSIVRARLRDRLPGLFEVVYYYGNQGALVMSYSPTENGYEAVFTLRVDARGVRLYFAQSPLLSAADTGKLLKGGAKQVRYVELSSVADFQRPEVEALIAAALDLAQVRLDPNTVGAVIIKADSQKKRAVRAKATVQVTS